MLINLFDILQIIMRIFVPFDNKNYRHILVKIPPKVSVSELVGTLKGRSAIRIFNKFRNLKEKPHWGNHFWAKGYCVDTVGLNAEMIQKYVKYQEEKEKRNEGN